MLNPRPLRNRRQALTLMAVLTAAAWAATGSPTGARAGTGAPDPAQCAALWLGVLDVAAAYPGYFGEMTDSRALAEDFLRQAGPDAGPEIAAQRPDMALIAKAKILGQDKISADLFDRMAERCATLESTVAPQPAE